MEKDLPEDLTSFKIILDQFSKDLIQYIYNVWLD